MALGEQKDSVVREAYLLSHDYIAYVTGRATGPAPSPATAALRHAGDDLLEKFPIFFKRWPRVFHDVTEDRACEFLLQILDENFQQQRDRQRLQTGYPRELAWSSVLSVYVLAGQMAVYCQANGMEGVLESLADQVGHYVEENVCPIIREKDGWDGFTARFARKEGPEVKVVRACCGILLLFVTLSLTCYFWKKRLLSSS